MKIVKLNLEAALEGATVRTTHGMRVRNLEFIEPKGKSRKQVRAQMFIPTGYYWTVNYWHLDGTYFSSEKSGLDLVIVEGMTLRDKIRERVRELKVKDFNRKVIRKFNKFPWAVFAYGALFGGSLMCLLLL